MARSVNSAEGTDGTRRAVAGFAVGAIGVGALVVFAARADSEFPGASALLTAVDVAVGLAFIVAAVSAPGSLVPRWLVGAVGASWLVGSFVPAARLLHQAVLLVALLAFSMGRLRDPVRWLAVFLAVSGAVFLVPQLGVAMLFASVAGVALVASRSGPKAAVFTGVAGGAVAAVLAASWLVARRYPSVFDPSVALFVYQLVLVLVAVGFLVASKGIFGNKATLDDEFFGDGLLAGLDGLAAVLSGALRDPELRVYRWDGPARGYVDGQGLAVGEGKNRRRLYVDDGTTRLAVVEHRSAALDDPPTAAAVSSAVRLAVSHLRLQAVMQIHLKDLQAARGRIVAAVDRQRTVTATRLREKVVVPLQAAIPELIAVRSTLGNNEAAQALEVAVRELTAAADEVVVLVAGVPPALLGDGRLRDALMALADDSPVRVTVNSSGDVGSDAGTETALFYVCSEALVNAVKHASASRVSIALRGDHDFLVVTVADDGCGGANSDGSGLRGLSDRLASRGGRLEVDSPLGTGTTVTATLPRHAILRHGLIVNDRTSNG